MWLLPLLGCPAPEPAPEAAAVAPMSDLELLSRASLDLRGRRPSVAELEAVEADPAELPALIDGFAEDARFGERVADLWSEIYLTRSETWPVQLAQLEVDATEAELIDALGREPLEIVRRVADEDLPYTELVTADWTMASEITAAIWPIARPEGEGWLPSRYTDSRPAAGVLSTNTMWWRYTSTDSNANRKRANQASRIFLCNDYLHRPIDFDRNVNLLDEEVLSDALRENPSCVNCHNSLDPMASYFFGFWWYTDAVADISSYHPDRELLWRDHTLTPPGYYGAPGDSLDDLGRQIAGDNRFVECAVEQAYELLLRREVTLADAPRLTEIRERFLAGGLTHRALLRAVVDAPEYRSGATDAAGYVPRKMLTPDLLADAVEDLTGFRWTNEGWDLLQSDARGFRTLAGGADGYYVTRDAVAPNATIVLVQKRLAEAAAAYAVDADGALFAVVDFTETPDAGREAMVAQIQALHLRLYGRRIAADGPEVEANLELWADLYAIEGDIRLAWAGLLGALLRDPDFLLY